MLQYKISFFVLFISLIGACGCQTLKETAKGVIGISTRQIEEARPAAIKDSLPYDYDTVLMGIKEELADIKAYIYKEDESNNMLAIYLSAADTTPVGIYLTKAGPSVTQVEVSSPSTYGKEFVAGKISMYFQDKQRSEKKIEVALAEVAAKPGDKNIIMPVKVSDISGLGFISCQVEVQFDPKAVKINAVDNDTSITLIWGKPLINITDGKAKIVLYGVKSIEGSGELFNLDMEVLPEALAGDSIMQLNEAKFNDGKINTILKNGKIIISASQGAVDAQKIE